ncbi:MAG: hypothetical protein AAF307_05145 [Pseudomonadota bacterium]
MKNIGQLSEADGRYEFRLPEMSLVVRGDHPEWVMHAASEIVASVTKNEVDGKIDELETLVEFDEASDMDVAAAKYAKKERFEIMPQCIVSMGRIDYRWVAPQGREKLNGSFDGQPYTRISDMSLTQNDSFLDNEAGVDMASGTK